MGSEMFSRNRVSLSCLSCGVRFVPTILCEESENHAAKIMYDLIRISGKRRASSSIEGEWKAARREKENCRWSSGVKIKGTSKYLTPSSLEDFRKQKKREHGE